MDTAEDESEDILRTKKKELRTTRMQNNFQKQVEEVINDLRPGLQADGGDIEILSCDESTGIVKARLEGACAGCALSPVTLKMGIEQELKDRVKGFREIQVEEGD